jgi:hypothetical protein
MPANTPKMGLATWNKPLDPYDYDQLTNNWNIVDYHDHSPGRGVPIPMGGIGTGAVGIAQLASNVPIVPTGGVILWVTNTPPAGYLLCNAASYQQSLYPALYAVIGSLFNNGSATGYFNVPGTSGTNPLTNGTSYYIIKT